MPDLVTIILTTLNSARYLRQSVESCLHQTYDNLELLVVDGGSTDETLDILQEYNDPRIQIIHQTNNEGKLPGAINRGMAHAHGKYLTWTQDDCWYETNAIETMVNYLVDHPDTALVYSDYWLVTSTDESENCEYILVSDPERILEEDVVQQSFLFRRIIYDAIGPQDERYFPVHEVPWRVKISRQFNIAPIHIPLQHYRYHQDSLTGRIGGYPLQRLSAQALLAEGYLSSNEYRRLMARIDINEGYASFVLHERYFSFWQYLVKGMIKDTTYISNRGLWKMALVSLSPSRGRYRQNLYQSWAARRALEQKDLMCATHQNEFYT